MSSFTKIYSNHLSSGAVSMIQNLTLQKIHEIVNHWEINPKTKKLFKFYNETRMVFLENDLVLFYHPTPKEDLEGEILEYVPNLIIENNIIRGTYVIAKIKNGNIEDLTDEDVLYIDGCYKQVLALKLTYLNKNNKSG